jgi:hypothetical protein
MTRGFPSVSRLVAGLSLLGVLACGGGGSPAAPAPPTGPPPTTAPTPVPPPVAQDGLTHEAVPADIVPAEPRMNQTVSARAPGYLFREQPFNGAPLFLWQIEQDYVNELVYFLEFTDGSFRMVRWAGGFTVTLDPELAANETVVRKTHEVVAELVRRTGLPITVGPNGQCRITLDGTILTENNAVGQASWTFQGATITSATVTFARIQEISGGSNADYANTLLHEMGHVLGLGHSPLTRDVMTPGAGGGTNVGEFQPREALTLHMMYAHRTAGNLPPDRHPAVTGASLSATPRVVVIRD